MRMLLIGLAVLGIAAVVVEGLWRVADQRREEAAFRALPEASSHDAQPERELKRSRYAEFLDRWPEGHRALAVRDMAAIWQEHDFSQLQPVSIDDPPGRIRQLAEHYERFLEEWSDGPRVEQVKKWLKNADDRMGGQRFDSLRRITSEDSPRQREELLKRSQAFINDNPLSRHVPTVKEWLIDGAALHSELMEYEVFHRMVDETIRRSDRARNRKEACLILEDFLAAHPQEGLNPRQAGDRARLLDRKDTLTAEVHQEWVDLKRQLERSASLRDDSTRLRTLFRPTDDSVMIQERGHFSVCIGLLNDFLDNNPPKYTEEAEKRISRLEEAWDRSVYQTLETKLRAMSRATHVTENMRDELRRAMGQYETREYPSPRMRDPVSDWIAWHDSLAEAQEARVQIEGIELPENSPLVRVHGNIILRIEMQGKHVDCDLGIRSREDNSPMSCDKEIDITLSMNQPVKVGIRSKWGPIWGPLDPGATATMTLFSREIPLSGNSGTLFVRIEGRPELPVYQVKGEQ